MLLVIIILFIHIEGRGGKLTEWNAELEMRIQLFQTQSLHPPIPNFYLMSAGNMASRLSNEKEHLPLNFLVSDTARILIGSAWVTTPNLGPVTVAG